MANEDQKPIQIIKPKSPLPGIPMGAFGFKEKFKLMFSKDKTKTQDKPDALAQVHLTLEKSGRLILQESLKTAFKIIVVFILALIFIVVLMQVVNTLNTGRTKESEAQPTPTRAVIKSKKPSVYAEDEKVLEVEEKINLLESKMSDTDIREAILKAPILDFNVDFKIKE